MFNIVRKWNTIVIGKLKPQLTILILKHDYMLIKSYIVTHGNVIHQSVTSHPFPIPERGIVQIVQCSAAQNCTHPSPITVYQGKSLYLGFHRHYHYSSSCTGLPVSYRIDFKLSTLTYHALSTQQQPYLASLLHLSNIPRQLRSSISQLIVPKTKLNLNVLSLSLRLRSGMNSLSLWKHLKLLLFSEKKLKTFIPNCISTIKCSVVPRSDTDFCASLFTIMFNDSVLLRLLAQVPEDIDAIEVNYYYYLWW